MAASQFNLAHAVDLMSRADDRSAVNAAREVIEAVADNGQVSGFCASILVKMATDPNFSDPEGGGAEVLDFLSQLQRLHPRLMAQGAQLQILTRVMESDLDEGLRSRFIARALHLQGHSDGPPLRDAIGAWQEMSAQLFNPHRAQSTWRRSAIEELLVAAIQTHTVEVLEAARPLLQHVLTHGPLASGGIDRRGVIMKAGLMSENGRWVEDDFRSALQLLDDMGFEIKRPEAEGPEHDEVFSTFGILHVISQSKSPHMMNAMLVALEAGCDPAARNSHHATPSDLVGDPAAWSRWLAVEQSHLARVAAMATLRDMGAGDDGLCDTGIIDNPKPSRKPQ